jgi:hypothetical protein
MIIGWYSAYLICPISSRAVHIEASESLYDFGWAEPGTYSKRAFWSLSERTAEA